MQSREKILDSLLALTGSSELGPRPELLRRVLETALTQVHADGATLLAPHQGRLERRAVTTERRDLPTLESPRQASKLTRVLMQASRPVRIADLAADPRVDPADACPELDAGPALFMPMRRREQIPGYLAVFRRRGAPAFTPAEADQLTLLAAWTAMALENLRLAESVEKLAVTDDLTQVYNYRFLQERAQPRDQARRRATGRSCRSSCSTWTTSRATTTVTATCAAATCCARWPGCWCGRCARSTWSPSTAGTSSRSSCRRPGSRAR